MTGIVLLSLLHMSVGVASDLWSSVMVNYSLTQQMSSHLTVVVLIMTVCNAGNIITFCHILFQLE